MRTSAILDLSLATTYLESAKAAFICLGPQKYKGVISMLEKQRALVHEILEYLETDNTPKGASDD